MGSDKINTTKTNRFDRVIFEQKNIQIFLEQSSAQAKGKGDLILSLELDCLVEHCKTIWLELEDLG